MGPNAFNSVSPNVDECVWQRVWGWGAGRQWRNIWISIRFLNPSPIVLQVHSSTENVQKNNSKYISTAGKDLPHTMTHKFFVHSKYILNNEWIKTQNVSLWRWDSNYRNSKQKWQHNNSPIQKVSFLCKLFHVSDILNAHRCQAYCGKLKIPCLSGALSLPFSLFCSP